MAETTVPKLLDAKDPDSVKLWADKVFIALQDLLGITPSSTTSTGNGMTIKSIQRGTIAITNTNSTGTATITSVDVAKSELRDLGQTSGTDSITALAYLVLTNATTITATRLGTTGTTTISWELTEYE